MASETRRQSLRSVGWAALLLALPLALFGALQPPNEYEEALGISALDCDGPFSVYLFAAPALVIYGTGLVINGLRWQRRINLIVALVCFFVCAALLANVARAVAQHREQATACASR
jgi:type IV secretory pathway VirB2 component (pilin)